MQDAYKALMATGFSEYESRAYCALLAQSPANGYQIAKRSGIPRAKVYECLERLVSRGAAVCVESSDTNGHMFAPTDFRVLIDDIEENMIAVCDRARKALDRVESDPRVVEVLWRVMSEKDMISRGRNLTENARKTLHVALWAEEFTLLLPSLLETVDRDVRLALVLYSPHDGIRQLQKRGAGAILHSRTKFQFIPVKGKQFVIVADRHRSIVGSIFPDGDVEGVFTENRGLVTNAADLVDHEIYLERILLEVGKPVMELYGDNLDGLDEFDPPGLPEGDSANKTAPETRE